MHASIQFDTLQNFDSLFTNVIVLRWRNFFWDL